MTSQTIAVGVVGDTAPGGPEYRVLGPVTIVGGPSWQCRPKARALLALLLLNANHRVSCADIAQELWDDDPPRSARANLRTYVARLRAALHEFGAGDLLTMSGGACRLTLRPEQLDLVCFRALSGRARAAHARGDLALAAAAFGQAGTLWRGWALEDVPAGTLLGPWKVALDEERLALVEEHVEVLLDQGRVAEALQELRPRAAACPLRERLHGQLMVALYRSGHRADALLTFRRLRAALHRELGVEPVPDLQRLHRRLLSADPGPSWGW